MSKQNRHVIKQNPETLPEAIKMGYMDDKNNLLIQIHPQIPFTVSLMIEAYFYDYVEFIYRVGGGRIFHYQLVDYAMKFKGLTNPQAERLIREMYQYQIINKKILWNSSLLYLTNYTMWFFDRPQQFDYSVGSLRRCAYKVEHYIRFKQDKQSLYKQYLIQNGIMTAESLEHLYNKLYIFPQLVEKYKSGKIVITFALLDVNSSKRVMDIIEKIHVINSKMNPDVPNIYFNLNVCMSDAQRLDYLKSKWDANTSKNINAVFYQSTGFTNLNVLRCFHHHMKKGGNESDNR